MTELQYEEEEPSLLDTIFCLKSIKSKEVYFSRLHRWAIYIIGLIESFTVSGCIMGYAQLVYVLKNEEIFLDLCQNETLAISADYYINSSVKQELKLAGCKEQDQKFALIYTIGLTAYGTFSFLIGMLLHHWGLAISRIIATSMIVFGFIALGLTTKENTFWLYLAMIFLALGGNQIRLSGLQFCNLFPEYRSTALTIISGSYAASAGLFIVFQLGQNAEIPLKTMSLVLAGFSLMSLVATLIMPWHHIPYNDNSRIENVPFAESALSFSNFFHNYWFAVQIGGISCHAVYFNTWISHIAETNEEAGIYSLIFSVSSFGCLLVTPFPGLLIDYLLKKAAKAPSHEERLIQELKCPSLALMIVTFLNTSLLICLLFKTSIAIYLSLFMRTVLRPSVYAVGSAFLRLRFPGEHFDRLNGIAGTIAALLSILQYPLFIWIQDNFDMAMVCMITLVVFTSLHALHLLSPRYRRRIAREKLLHRRPSTVRFPPLTFPNNRIDPIPVRVSSADQRENVNNIDSIYQRMTDITLNGNPHRLEHLDSHDRLQRLERLERLDRQAVQEKYIHEDTSDDVTLYSRRKQSSQTEINN